MISLTIKKATIMPKTNIGKTARIMLENNSGLPKILTNLIGLADRKNLIHLNGHLKRMIIGKYDIKTLSYLDVTISRYIEQDYLIRLAESTYMLNPHCAFKCSNPEYQMLVDIYSIKKSEIENKKLKIENEKLKEKIEGIKIINKVNDILGN